MKKYKYENSEYSNRLAQKNVADDIANLVNERRKDGSPRLKVYNIINLNDD